MKYILACLAAAAAADYVLPAIRDLDGDEVVEGDEEVEEDGALTEEEEQAIQDDYEATVTAFCAE